MTAEPRRTLIFATRNRGKLAELTSLVAPLGLSVVSVADRPEVPDVEEDGNTFEANATKKARLVAEATGLPSLADDSGLVVDALNGEPGVRSARYAGHRADDRANNARLLAALEGVPSASRAAHFVCVMALADPHGALGQAVRITRGQCAGQILEAPRGAGGFGYDPLFLVPELGQTFAELAPEQKNEISHRARAMAAMGEILRDYFSK
jgi:XTP/dITP diphosphohydrolase